MGFFNELLIESSDNELSMFSGGDMSPMNSSDNELLNNSGDDESLVKSSDNNLLIDI